MIGDSYDEFEKQLEEARENAERDVKRAKSPNDGGGDTGKGVLMESVPQITLRTEEEEDEDEGSDHSFDKHGHRSGLTARFEIDDDSYPSPGKRTYASSHLDSGHAALPNSSSLNTSALYSDTGSPKDTHSQSTPKEAPWNTPKETYYVQPLYNYDSVSDDPLPSTQMYSIATPAPNIFTPYTERSDSVRGLPQAIPSAGRPTAHDWAVKSSGSYHPDSDSDSLDGHGSSSALKAQMLKEARQSPTEIPLSPSASPREVWNKEASSVASSFEHPKPRNDLTLPKAHLPSYHTDTSTPSSESCSSDDEAKARDHDVRGIDHAPSGSPRSGSDTNRTKRETLRSQGPSGFKDSELAALDVHESPERSAREKEGVSGSPHSPSSLHIAPLSPHPNPDKCSSRSDLSIDSPRASILGVEKQRDDVSASVSTVKVSPIATPPSSPRMGDVEVHQSPTGETRLSPGIPRRITDESHVHSSMSSSSSESSVPLKDASLSPVPRYSSKASSKSSSKPAQSGRDAIWKQHLPKKDSLQSSLSSSQDTGWKKGTSNHSSKAPSDTRGEADVVVGDTRRQDVLPPSPLPPHLSMSDKRSINSSHSSKQRDKRSPRETTIAYVGEDSRSQASRRSRVSQKSPFAAQSPGPRPFSLKDSESDVSGVSDIGKIPPVAAAFRTYGADDASPTRAAFGSSPRNRFAPLLGDRPSLPTHEEEETPSESSEAPQGRKEEMAMKKSSSIKSGSSKSGSRKLDHKQLPYGDLSRMSHKSSDDKSQSLGSEVHDKLTPLQSTLHGYDSHHENLQSYLGLDRESRQESKDTFPHSTSSHDSVESPSRMQYPKAYDDYYQGSGTPRKVASSDESERFSLSRRAESPRDASIASASLLKRAPSRKSASQPSRYSVTSSSSSSSSKSVISRGKVDSHTPELSGWAPQDTRKVANVIKVTPTSEDSERLPESGYVPTNKRGSIMGPAVNSRNSLDVPTSPSPRSRRQSSYMREESRQSSPRQSFSQMHPLDSQRSSPRASIPQIYKLDSPRRGSRVSQVSRRDSDDIGIHHHEYSRRTSDADRRGSMLSHHHHHHHYGGNGHLPPLGGRQKFVSEWFQDRTQVCGHWECKIPWLDAQVKVSIGRKARRPEVLLISIRVAGVGSKLRGDRLLRQSNTANQERWKFTRLDHYQSERQWPPNKDHIMWLHSSHSTSEKVRDTYHHGKGEIFFFKSTFEGMWENMAKAQYLLLALCRIFDVETMPQIPISSSVSDAFNFSSAMDLSKVFVSVIRSPDTELRAPRPRSIANSDGGDFYFFESIGFNCLATYLLSHLSITGFSTFDLTRHDREEEVELMNLFPSLLESETRPAEKSRRSDHRSSVTSNVAAYGQAWNFQMPGASEEELRMLTNVKGRKGIHYFFWDPESRVHRGADLPFVQSARGNARFILLNFYSGRCLFFDTQGTSGKAICEAFAAFLLHLRFPSSLMYTPDEKYFDFIRFRQQSASLEDTANSSMTPESKWRSLEKIFQQWTYESQVSPWATNLQCSVDCGTGRTARFYYSLDLYTIEKEVPRDKHKDIDSRYSSSQSSHRRGDGYPHEQEDVDLVVEQYVVCQVLSNLRRYSPQGFNPLIHDASGQEIIKASFKLCDETEHAASPSIRTMFTVFRAALWFLQCLHWINGEASRLQANRDIGGINSARGISGISSVFPDHPGANDRNRVLYFFKNGLWVYSPTLTNQRQLKIQHDESHGLKHEKQGFRLGDLDVTYAGSQKPGDGTPRKKSDVTSSKKKKRRASKDSTHTSPPQTVYVAQPLATVYHHPIPAFKVNNAAEASLDPALRCILPPKGIPLALNVQPSGASYLQATTDGRSTKRTSSMKKKKQSQSVVDVLARGGAIAWNETGAPIPLEDPTTRPAPLDIINYGPQPSKEIIKLQKAYLNSISPKYTHAPDGQVIATVQPQMRIPKELWTSPGWMFPGSRAAIRSSLAHKAQIFPSPVYPQPYLSYSNPHPIWGYTQSLVIPPPTSAMDPGPPDDLIKYALINNGTSNLAEVPFQPLEGKYNPGCGMRFV